MPSGHPSRERTALSFGVALLSAGAIVLEISLTRIYSAFFGHALAFLAVSVSMLGAGAGAGLLRAFPGICRSPKLFSGLAYLSSLAAAATIVSLIALFHEKPAAIATLNALRPLGLTYALSALPFVFVGAAIAAALTRSAREAGALYRVDLMGAALGAPLAIVALRAGASRTGLFVAIAFALAGVVFALGPPAARDEAASPSVEARPRSAPVATAALATVVLLLGDMWVPWLKLPVMRWAGSDRIDTTEWSELGLVSVDKPSGGSTWIRFDGGGASQILDMKTTPPLHPDEMAYVLHRDQGPVLVLGAGGGRDVRAALKYGQKNIDAVEVNPLVVTRVMRGKYKELSGGLYDRPDVNVIVADGRAYLRSTPKLYRNIVLSLVETHAASSAGALAPVESGLYTIEAFRDYLAHLPPEGTLIVTRWDHEADRLLVLAGAALRDMGADKPAAHLYACSAARSTSMLIKKSPLGSGELRELRKLCRKNKFMEVFAPDDAHGSGRAALVETGAHAGPTDLTPPTDDRPFFFYTVPLRRALAALAHPLDLSTEDRGLAVIAGLFAVSLAFGAVFLLVPPLVSRASPSRSPLFGPFVFFAAIGAGFSLAEIAVVHVLTVFLGHPVYALAVVLSSLLGWAALGSHRSGLFHAGEAPAAMGARAATVAVMLGVLAATLGPVLSGLGGLPLGVRIALVVLLLAPLGMLMGMLVPLGVQRLSDLPHRVAWCWSAHGFAAVAAAAVATLIAMQLGFSAALLAGGLCYWIGALASRGT